MDRINGAPQIVGQPSNFGGVQVTGVGFADPEKFPAGLEIVLLSPGKLEPVGRFTLPPGLALAMIGPSQAARDLVQATRQARDRAAPGMTLPPGM